MAKKIVFLDRDGTLIVNKHYLNSVDEIEYLPGVFQALKSLQDHGYEFVIATNQSGVPRGWVTEQNLTDIHDKMQRDFLEYGIRFLAINYAPHLPETNHPDRKPNAGMLLKVQKDHDVDFQKSWMIGDSPVDWEAGWNAGVSSILINTKHLKDYPKDRLFVADDWDTILKHILSHN